MRTKRLGWPGPKTAKCKTKNRSHAATVNMVQGGFWKLKQTVRAFLRSAPVLPFWVGPNPTDHPWWQPPCLCPFAFAPQYRAPGSEDLFSLRGLSVMGAVAKPLIPIRSAWSSRGSLRAAVVCSLLLSPEVHAETSSERGLLGAVASGDQRGYASCIILHRDDVLFQLPPAVRGRNLRGPMAL